MQNTGYSYGATVSVNITQFRPLGSVFPVSATFGIAAGSPGVTLTPGNSIVVAGSQPATLVFQLATPGFVFVGATFDSPAAGTDVGSTEFPSVTIDRTRQGNTLTVTDANTTQDAGKGYSYVLLVQNTVTGEIGIIDPMIISDPGP